ncbi:hypothetical protein SAY86_000994 [Trapa natans]|uniref:Exocyst complex component SEC5 n=1 Tax=Trapa natans TaxID=22666 RepID=A0AAN7N065_TRANT|nr:hypothetical protein SAY86_000994 [Trapa natans]
MSSDSEDLDEDELLQIALKEQANRDLSYQKPSATAGRKPVANYVQQSQQKSSKKAGSYSSSSNAANRSKAGNRNSIVADDEDDSEVEMLSISSGDEDSSKYSQKTGRSGGARGARGPKEDDRTWDGDEPACWKQVDEAELAHRVREMRESRTVLVVQKLEKVASVVGRKGLNNLTSFPHGMECVDPLGLGIIDQRSLRLITESLDSSPSNNRDQLDSSLHEKLMYFSEKFDAKLFLSRIHQNTSAADLEAGSHALKTDFKGRTQQRKQLVKDNFDCFVSCKTTIDDIELKLRRIEEDPEGAGTNHLQKCFQGVNSLAARAFEPLFERQAQAEKIRSVQGILQRFRTLFNLPSTIRESISKGERDLAVREYKKAKSIALPFHVGILKRVLEEVEKVMHEFKGTLYKSMEDPNIDLTLLENTVRLLLELEPESDPVWHYLSIQNQRIRGLLEKCTSDHEARMETLQIEIREKALSDAKWRHIQQDLNQNPDRNARLSIDSQPAELTGEEVDALRGKYIRRLTAVIVNHIPAFWKVALSVFSVKFAKSSQASTETSMNNPASNTEEKVGEGKYSSHSLDEVANMIRQILSTYEAKVHSTFHDLEESNILWPYMNDCIREISKACQTFEIKDSAPSTAVSALRMLHSEVTKIYILRLCLWMRSTTEDISKEETWVHVSILERNRSPYSISNMPLSFRSIIISSMDQISLMIQSIKAEATRSEDMFMQLREIQESVRLAFLNCFLDFSGHLERIGGELGQDKSGKENSYFQNGYAYAYETEEKLSAEFPGSVVDPHQQLLIVLSNIGYCKDELCHELYHKFNHIWQQSGVKDEADSDIQDLVMCFTGLEEKVLAHYTIAKANLIRTAAVNYLLDSGVHWGSAPAVKGVRDAAVELLHSLVAVHAEVFAGAKPLLDKTLSILVEGLIDTFLSLVNENKDKDLRALDANGFCQLMLELEYFEIILKPYFTSDARESLKSLQGDLLEKATEGVIEAAENPGHARRATRGSEDALVDERQQGGASVSPDDLIALAQQYSSELLQAELERTRINTACFVESIPFDTVPEPAYTSSFRGGPAAMDSPSRNHRGSQTTVSQSFSRHRQR